MLLPSLKVLRKVGTEDIMNTNVLSEALALYFSGLNVV